MLMMLMVGYHRKPKFKPNNRRIEKLRIWWHFSNFGLKPVD
jgi:hypothetical protein